jgi:hypothetical protein
VAVLIGPIVLARDARLGGDIDSAVQLKIEPNNRIKLDAVVEPGANPMQMVWSVPTETGGAILMCDYASAGNTWSDESRYRVWMPVDSPAQTEGLSALSP